LILSRIADLARAHYDKAHGLTPEGRKALAGALDRIQGEGFKALPDVFVGAKSDKDRELERNYLEDVAVGAVDLLLERVSADARRLLWVVTRASEPSTEGMIAGVWSGESQGDEQLRQIAQFMRMLEQLPPEARAKVPPMPEELRAELEAWQKRAGPEPP